MIILDLPPALSVNRTRRIDWSAKPAMRQWTKAADALMMSHGRLPDRILGRFQVTIILPEGSRLDGDNTIKGLVDYVKRIELIRDDSPRYMRRLVVEFGDAPTGSRVILEELS